MHRVCSGLAALTAAAAPSLRVVLLSVGAGEVLGKPGSLCLLQFTSWEPIWEL